MIPLMWKYFWITLLEVILGDIFKHPVISVLSTSVENSL